MAEMPSDGFVLVCPCEGWQLAVPLDVVNSMHPAKLHDAVEEALLEHMAGCIIMAASRMTADAARGR